MSDFDKAIEEQKQYILKENKKTRDNYFEEKMKQIENTIKEIYDSNKEKLESVFFINKVQKGKVLKFKVPTKIHYVIQRKKDDSIYYSVSLESQNNNKMNDLILTAQWHGTTNIKQELINFAETQQNNPKDVKTQSMYYTNPTSMDIKFKNTIKKRIREIKF